MGLLKKVKQHFCKDHFCKKEYIKNIQEEIKKELGEKNIEIEELVYYEFDDGKKSKTKKSDTEKIYTLVYVDKLLDVDWLRKTEENADNLALVNRAMLLESLPHKHLPKNEVIEFKKIISYAVLAGFENNEAEVDSLIKYAKEYHKNRVTERSRLWMLSFSFIFCLLAIVSFSLSYVKLDSTALNCICISMYGLVGAFISLNQRIAVQNLDSASGWLLHMLEVASKLIIGAISGFLVTVIASSSYLPIVIKDLPENPANYYIFAFIAGFSEKFIPTIVSKYENVLQEQNK